MSFNNNTYKINSQVESERLLFIIGGDLRGVVQKIYDIIKEINTKDKDELCRLINISTYTELVKENGVKVKDADKFISISIVRKYKSILSQHGVKIDSLKEIEVILDRESNDHYFDGDYNFSLSYDFSWRNYTIMKKIINIYGHNDIYDYEPKDVPYIISNYFINRRVSFLVICCALYPDLAKNICDEMKNRSWGSQKWENLRMSFKNREKPLFKDGVFDINNSSAIDELAKSVSCKISDFDNIIINKVKGIINKKNNKKHKNSTNFKFSENLLENLNLTISI